MLAPFFTFLLVNLSRNLGGISCSWESENDIIDETWWQLQCEFRLLKNSCRLCHHLLWLLSPVSGSSFSSGSVTQGEENKWQIQIPFCPWVDEKKNKQKRDSRGSPIAGHITEILVLLKHYSEVHLLIMTRRVL